MTMRHITYLVYLLASFVGPGELLRVQEAEKNGNINYDTNRILVSLIGVEKPGTRSVAYAGFRFSGINLTKF